MIRRLWLAARLAAAVAVVVRLARAARRGEPLTVGPAPPTDLDDDATISVVIPARDEEDRLAPVLELLAADPSVTEVIVVDDESRDGTADARPRARARPSSPVPRSRRVGWASRGRSTRACAPPRGDWVVCFDADVEPSPGLARALVDRVQADGLDMASVAGRFVCPTAPLRVLHPALLTTLVYRFGPPGASPARPGRVLANGQCTAVRRADLLAAGGYTVAAGNLTDDVALARSLAAHGWRTGLLDGTSALRVRMHTSAGDAWRAWGRSLPMPDATPVAAQLVDGFTLLVTQALPLPRLLLRRADALDLALLALRAGTLAGTARAYERRDLAYWLSPLADPAAVLRVLWGAVRPGAVLAGPHLPATGATGGGVALAVGRHGEAQADDAHERARGGDVRSGLEQGLDHGEAEDRDASTDGEAPRHERDDGAQQRRRSAPAPGPARASRRRRSAPTVRRGTPRTRARRAPPSPPPPRRSRPTTARPAGGRRARRARPWRRRPRRPGRRPAAPAGPSRSSSRGCDPPPPGCPRPVPGPPARPPAPSPADSRPPP